MSWAGKVRLREGALTSLRGRHGAIVWTGILHSAVCVPSWLGGKAGERRAGEGARTWVNFSEQAAVSAEPVAGRHSHDS